MAMHDVHGGGGHSFGPETIVGKWCVGLFLVFVVAFAAFVTLALIGAGTWEPEFSANLEATIPLLIAAISAMASLVVGLVATVRGGERSTGVILATVISGMVTFFFTGELLSVIGVLPQH